MHKHDSTQRSFNRLNVSFKKNDPKGEATMRRITKAVLALALGLGLWSSAHAAASDSLTVTITPNAFYAVDIDTANVVLNLGTVALSASTQTVSPSTVTIQSSFATTDLKLQGSIASVGTPWTFDDDTSSTEANKLAAWASFTSVAHSTAPAQAGDYFSGTVAGDPASDVIDTSSRYVGDSADDSTSDLFEVNTGHGSKDMDALAPDPNPLAKALIWLRFRLPNATATPDAQNITVLLTAVAPN